MDIIADDLVANNHYNINEIRFGIPGFKKGFNAFLCCFAAVFNYGSGKFCQGIKFCIKRSASSADF